MPPATPPAIPTSWTVTDLPPLAGYNAAQANAVNSLGHAAGYSQDSNGKEEATEWIAGAAIDLGPGIATGINDSDQIVGYVMTEAFLWQAGAMIDLGSWQPTGINNSGEVVGISADGLSGMAWTPASGGLQLVADCRAVLGINDKGQMAGISVDGTAKLCGGVDFAVPGAATAINSSGTAVGYSENPSDAWLWPAMDIASNGMASGINDFGWVVGEQIIAAGPMVVHTRIIHGELIGQSHPFIWSEASGIVSLPSPLVTAEAINGKFVVGAGIVGDGTIEGILLEGKP